MDVDIKTYKIKTIEELTDLVTSSNLDYMIKDLYNFLLLSAKLGKDKYDSTCFEWSNDYKSNVYLSATSYEGQWNEYEKQKLIDSIPNASYHEDTNELIIPGYMGIIGNAYIKLPHL